MQNFKIRIVSDNIYLYLSDDLGFPPMYPKSVLFCNFLIMFSLNFCHVGTWNLKLHKSEFCKFGFRIKSLMPFKKKVMFLKSTQQ